MTNLRLPTLALRRKIKLCLTAKSGDKLIMENAENKMPECATTEQLEQIFQYIRENWQILRRSNVNLAHSAADPKFETQTGKSVVYLSQTENLQNVSAKLEREMSANRPFFPSTPIFDHLNFLKNDDRSGKATHLERVPRDGIRRRRAIHL